MLLAKLGWQEIGLYVCACVWEAHFLCVQGPLPACMLHSHCSRFVISCVQIPKEEAQAFARENRIHYMESSAKSRLNVDEAYFEVVRAIRWRYDAVCLFFIGAFLAGVWPVLIVDGGATLTDRSSTANIKTKGVYAGSGIIPGNNFDMKAMCSL